ncbi:MAG: ATP-grasp domain-containing protein [Myxococcales bacterium]|nr:ATP-grasp domain-containing protein [Myxococcales bacterium]
MNAADLTLIVPEKADVERDAVAAAWEGAGGTVLRLGRFWDPPPLASESVRVYGNDTFCLVLQQKLGLTLTTPADDLLFAVQQSLLRRELIRCRRAGLADLSFPVFLKSLVPKQIRSRVYESSDEVVRESAGLDEDTEFLASEVVAFTAEARSFVLEGEVLEGEHGQAQVLATAALTDDWNGTPTGRPE